MTEKKKIKIKINDEEARGSYANFLKINYNKEEFVLDFANIIPPTGIITSRVILSPGHLKRIISVLEKNLEVYESKYGKVEEMKPLEKKNDFGFKGE